ncbi:hypothetical protein P3T76_010331 [Phytophthora citrophthora]|uniref:Uncharacterized protein n=1 Tax=Phytophthora citrophthora TaxID=4793 RepID=A0AAD9GBV4_9STRA|nr:hypothetical protein P3T76_010331 [Phytophthora citrophthora]
MAFLRSDEDSSVFQAALDFVDEYERECRGDAFSLTEKPPPKTDQGLGGPSFPLACSMVPFHTTNLWKASSNLQLLLQSSEEMEKRPKSRKLPANTNRARDEVQYELAFLNGKVANNN